MQPSRGIFPFPNSQHEDAGAIIAGVDVLLSVKHMKTEDNLITDKTKIFFSHDIEGHLSKYGAFVGA